MLAFPAERNVCNIALQDHKLLQRYAERGKECLSRLFDSRQFTFASMDRLFAQFENNLKVFGADTRNCCCNCQYHCFHL